MGEKGKGIDYPLYWDDIDRGTDWEQYPYEDGPRATGGSDSYFDEHCHDNERVGWAYDDREGWCYHTELAGKWYFPGLDLAVQAAKAEPKGYIQVEACEQGFLVVWDGDTLAFADRVDAAGWLLGWLGFEDEIIESVLDILEGLGAAETLYSILSDCVAGVDYDELVARAVSWNDPEQRKPLEYERALDVVGEAWAFIEEVEAGGFGEDGQYQKLVEAVKKWQGIEGGEEIRLPIEGTILTDIQQADAMERLDRR